MSILDFKWHFVTRWKPPASQADSRLNLEALDWGGHRQQAPAGCCSVPSPRSQGVGSLLSGLGQAHLPQDTKEEQVHPAPTPSLPSTSKVTSGYSPASALDRVPLVWALRPRKKKQSEVAQLCPTLCDPMDCSLPGSSIHGILQARVLEWVAISFSRASSRPRDGTQVSRIAGRCFTI